MNKNLIAAAILLLAGYLAYDTYSESNEVDLNAIATVQQNTSSSEDNVAQEEFFSSNSAYLDGVYTLNIKSTKMETNQIYKFSSDGTFSLRRYFVEPSDAGKDLTSSGNYEIHKTNIALYFDNDRDKKVFPEDSLYLKMLETGDLKYGNFTVKKQ